MTKKTSQESPTYEQAVARLEQIVDEMNSGNLPLDAALKLYEEGDQLLRFCSNALSQAQNKIEVLVKDRQGELQIVNGKPATQELAQAPFTSN
jgi:exodeoxyribonuclease VII small subunit